MAAEGGDPAPATLVEEENDPPVVRSLFVLPLRDVPRPLERVVTFGTSKVAQSASWWACVKLFGLAVANTTFSAYLLRKVIVIRKSDCGMYEKIDFVKLWTFYYSSQKRSLRFLRFLIYSIIFSCILNISC